MPENKQVEAVLIQFQEYLLSILGVYQDLLPELKRELESVQKDDIAELNGCLKNQQALLLKAKNFDSKVTGFQSKLGISALNFSPWLNWKRIVCLVALNVSVGLSNTPRINVEAVKYPVFTEKPSQS